MKTSGGVRMAAKTKMAIMNTFLFFAKNWGVTMPILVRNRNTSGNSKTIPKAKIIRVMKDKYLLMEIIGCKELPPKLSKNLKPTGMTRK